MKILTCNIRYYGAPDGANGWDYRKDFCVEVIRSRTPDLICFQEMCWEQLDYLKPAFPEFDNFGMIDKPTGGSPVNTVFYRRDTFAMQGQGGYWLSETPHIPGTKSWDSCWERLANWACLKETASQQEFKIINTHLDNEGQQAREEQAKLISEDTQAYPQSYAQILTGDMNCDTTNKAIHVLKKAGWRDSYGIVHGTEDPGHTFHEFQGEDIQSDVGKMDWVFTKGKIEVEAAEVIKDDVKGKFPSDHYFVAAELKVISN